MVQDFDNHRAILDDGAIFKLSAKFRHSSIIYKAMENWRCRGKKLRRD
jgi:hypothetical protein